MMMLRKELELIEMMISSLQLSVKMLAQAMDDLTTGAGKPTPLGVG